MMSFQAVVATVGHVIEAVGVIVIVIGFVLSSVWYLSRLREGSPLDAYHRFRQDLGRSLMLGLEFLIAGDIIRTIIVEQTLSAVLALAVIVLIRIILSLALEFETEGRWPWQREKT
jgi:uncharacterized membrane protein